MKKIISRILLLFTFSSAAYLLPAQETDLNHHCGTVLYNMDLQNNSPETKLNRELIQRKISEYLAKNADSRYSTREILSIPVVVHVVWNTEEQNIPDDQVWSQIFILNEDYRRNNPDTIHTPLMFRPFAADCGIEFCLAQRAPFDTAAASGIVRVFTETPEFWLDNKMKNPYEGGSRAWDARHYLNIWVCNLGGNYLGYAQYPGGPDSTDGIVVDYKCFGCVGNLHPHYNKGRTATHEIGHWLDLYHIWGDDFGSCDGSDYIDDTPNAADANYYCPSHPRTSNCNSAGEMFMNYMDYVDDICFNLFTYGQRDRMIAAINVARPELLVSDGCVPYDAIAEISHNIHLDIFPNPAHDVFTLAFVLPLPATAVVTLTNVLGKEVYRLKTKKQTDFQVPVDISGQGAGIYFLKVQAGKYTAAAKLIVHQ